MNLRNHFKSELNKIIATTLAIIVIAFVGFVITEPGDLNASTSQAVAVTLNVTSGISISVDSNAVTMSTALDAFGTNSAVATSTFTVITTNSSGYTFTLAASTNPAMKSGAQTISDYSTTTNPSTWSVASGDARFGFSVFGTDKKNGPWGSGSLCDSGTSTPDTNLKYFGFYTTATTTAGNSSITTPQGDATTVCYAVQQNNYFIQGGVYTATITGTATTN